MPASSASNRRPKARTARVAPVLVVGLVALLAALSLGTGWLVIRHFNDDAESASRFYSEVFAGLNDPFEATRYHSLVVQKDSLPDALEITAWTEDEHGGIDEIMGLRHRTWRAEGVQFHPESILTEHGQDLLRNFLDEPKL